jgi:predicted protein tyrosine phosphatase
MRVLFICSQNRLRSPTAEQIFASWEGIEVASAGLADEAQKPVTPELLAWAHLIFVMEKAHRSKLAKKLGVGDGMRFNRIMCRWRAQAGRRVGWRRLGKLSGKVARGGQHCGTIQPVLTVAQRVGNCTAAQSLAYCYPANSSLSFWSRLSLRS